MVQSWLGQAKPRNQEFHPVFHMVAGTIFLCFPRHVIGGLDWKWSSWYLNWYQYSIPAPKVEAQRAVPLPWFPVATSLMALIPMCFTSQNVFMNTANFEHERFYYPLILCSIFCLESCYPAAQVTHVNNAVLPHCFLYQAQNLVLSQYLLHDP